METITEFLTSHHVHGNIRQKKWVSIFFCINDEEYMHPQTKKKHTKNVHRLANRTCLTNFPQTGTFTTNVTHSASTSYTHTFRDGMCDKTLTLCPNQSLAFLISLHALAFIFLSGHESVVILCFRCNVSRWNG